jgi:hypothetical protein
VAQRQAVDGPAHRSRGCRLFLGIRGLELVGGGFLRVIIDVELSRWKEGVRFLVIRHYRNRKLQEIAEMKR